MTADQRRGRRLRPRLAVVVAALSLAGAGLATAPAAAAAPARSAGGDFCTTDDGVTVVVDFSDLGGAIVVRCVDGPLPSGYDGWDALTDAGFQPQGVARFPGFVCRLSGQPTASQTFDIPEDSQYRERCAVTPPTSAYWGYWYAKNGGSWTYSSAGAANHRVIEGGFEGWSFSLNSGGHPPAPGVAPEHSVTAPPSTPGGGSGGGGDRPKHPDRPDGGQGGSADTPAGAGGSTGGSGPSSSAQSPTSDSPSTTSGDGKPSGGKNDDQGAGGGGNHNGDRHEKGTDEQSSSASPTPTGEAADEDQVVVTSELPTDPAADDASSGPSTSTLIGIGVLVLLAVGGGLTAWRRSRRA